MSALRKQRKKQIARSWSERPVERLYGAARKPAVLLRVRSMFGRSPIFMLVAADATSGLTYPTQTAAHAA